MMAGLKGPLQIWRGPLAIRTDAEGRYCLNDLHRASGGEAKHRPNYWIENAQTRELIAEMEKAGNPAIHAKQGLGTFVAKELVYAYAMWISPAFHLKVIRAYDQLVSAPVHQIPQSLPEVLRRDGCARVIRDRDSRRPASASTPSSS